MIGDILRLSGRPGEALTEFRLSLTTDPGRFDTLLSAGETAQTLGFNGEAAEDYRTLLRNAAHPSSDAAQALAPARSFLRGALRTGSSP